jgi:hypothetical protein
MREETEIVEAIEATPASAPDEKTEICKLIERQTDVLGQQNYLLEKLTKAVDQLAIAYRVLMNVENRVEDLEKSPPWTPRSDSPRLPIAGATAINGEDDRAAS